MQWWRGHRPAAEEAASEAIDDADRRRRPEAARPGATATRLNCSCSSDENERCIEYGERAVALAREVGDPAILSHALNNVGSAHWSLGHRTNGRAELAESLSVALAAGEVDHACRAYINTGWRLMEDRDLDEAERYIAGAMALAEGAEHVGFLGYGYLGRALIDFHRGAWDDAVGYADVRLDCELAVTRCWALTVKGRVRVRRGHPGGDELLARAMEIAEEVGELDRIGLIAAGRAEAAWLRGDAEAALRHVRPAYEWAVRVGRSPRRAELEYWMVRCGDPVRPADPTHPYAFQVAGAAARAAAIWDAHGFPYERAAALAETGRQEDMLAALEILDQLGAEPMARIVRARLRDLGAHRIPRGPAATTRQNPAGLTNRQVEVARMVGAGMTNAEIAGQLVVSVRTVDNHVAAVLQKLGATTRRDVATRARSLGRGPGGGRLTARLPDRMNQHLAADRREADGQERAQRTGVARRDRGEYGFPGRNPAQGVHQERATEAAALTLGSRLDAQFRPTGQPPAQRHDAALVAENAHVRPDRRGVPHPRMVGQVGPFRQAVAAAAARDQRRVDDVDPAGRAGEPAEEVRRERTAVAVRLAGVDLGRGQRGGDDGVTGEAV